MDASRYCICVDFSLLGEIHTLPFTSLWPQFEKVKPMINDDDVDVDVR